MITDLIQTQTNVQERCRHRCASRVGVKARSIVVPLSGIGVQVHRQLSGGFEPRQAPTIPVRVSRRST